MELEDLSTATDTNPNKYIFKCDVNLPELLKCGQCEYETRLKVSLRNHIGVFHEKGNGVNLYDILQCYKCENFKCDFKTYSLIVLTKHAPNCPENGSNNEDKWEKTLKKPEEWFKCDWCAYTTKYKFYLREHTAVQHTTGLDAVWYKCDHCKYQTKAESKFRAHMRAKHPDKYIKCFKCAQCSYKSKSKKYLKTHILKHHVGNGRRETAPENYCLKVQASSEPSDVWFECARCAFRTKRRECLKEHVNCAGVRVIKSAVWFKCEQCSFRTKYKATLRKHARGHSSVDKIEWFECDQCAYRSKQEPFLKYHKLNKHSVLQRTENIE